MLLPGSLREHRRAHRAPGFAESGGQGRFDAIEVVGFSELGLVTDDKAEAASLFGARRGHTFLRRRDGKNRTRRPYGFVTRRLGEQAGTRALIEVLLLYRSHSTDVMASAIAEALAAGAIDPQAIALLARHRAQPNTAEQLGLEVGELSRYARPEPDTHAYEALTGRAS